MLIKIDSNYYFFKPHFFVFNLENTTDFPSCNSGTISLYRSFIPLLLVSILVQCLNLTVVYSWKTSKNCPKRVGFFATGPLDE